MLFRIKENEILILVEQFLKSQHLLGSLRALEKESNVVLGNLDEDAQFLRELVMDGEWSNVLEYLNPLRDNPSYKNVRLMIEKQRYLELLATERGSYDAGQVMKSLSVLEEMCPTRHEYTALCYLLTRPHLTQHPPYTTWTHYQSRLECFQAMHTLLLKPDQKTGEEELPTPGRLVDLLTKGMFYESALQLCSHKLAPGGCVNITDALTNNLLQCRIADKEAVLLHWLYEIPTSALVKPGNKKIVQVELETGRPPALSREPTLVQSTEFHKSRNVSRDVYGSIDRSNFPLKSGSLPSSLLPTTLGNNGVLKTAMEYEDTEVKEDKQDTTTSTLTNSKENALEHTLGDSEVAVDQGSGVLQDGEQAGLLTWTDQHDSNHNNRSRPTEPRNREVKSKGKEEKTMAATELFVPSLLEIEMGFKDVRLVGTKESETQNDETVRDTKETEGDLKETEGDSKETEGKKKEAVQEMGTPFSSSPELILSYTQQQEGKIKWLQKQLNELRIQQDSLRMSAALEQAGKVPSHASLGGIRTPTRPLYEHPNNMGTQPDEPAVLFSDVTHSAATDRGTSVGCDKPTTTATSNGWLEPNHSSLHTLESFSEDSLRPSKTSTPSKLVNPVTCHKVADSSMLKVKFAPTAVLEDVQPIRCAAFHPRVELIAIGSNSKALRVCSCHMLSDSVQTLVRDDGCQDLPVLFKRNRHHRGSVYAVAWNPAGNVIATGSNDKSVIVVGFDADNCISNSTDREFSFHTGTVRDIHFHDNACMLSVGGGDNLLHVSDVEKGVELSAYSGHTGTVHAVTSHRDTLLTGSEDGTIRLWDRRSNACTRVIGAALGTQGKSGITSLSLNNFGNLLCASRDDGLCMLYDIEMGKLLAAFSPHTPATCKSVQFYRNPRYILSGSYDGTIALTCAEQVLLNPEINCTEILGTHRDKVTRVTWHPTKQAFATCSADRTVCLWTAKEGVDD